jgi:hypothetical protein
MGGGLMQLVAYGAQDVYLTGNPQITFFKIIYRRHTNFSMETINQTFNADVQFGKKTSVTISRNGDLVNDMFLEIKLPILKQIQTTDSTDSTYVSWTNGIGNALIKSVSIEIGGQEIDKHYGEWLDIWSELNLTDSKKKNYNKMVGNNYPSGDFSPELVYTYATGTTKLYVPLRFWFNRNPGLALPLIALQYHEVKINMEVEESKYLIRNDNGHINAPIMVDDNGEDKPLEIADCELLINYIYLDTDERRRFTQVSHEYLIEQIQYLGSNNIDANSSVHTINLNFNHPVKSLHWILQDKTYLAYDSNAINIDNKELDSGNQKLRYSALAEFNKNNDTFKAGKIQLNGHDRMSEKDADYFRLVQNNKHMQGSPDKYIYTYSFALNPSEHQPSGTCNFSRVDSAKLYLTFNTDSASTNTKTDGLTTYTGHISNDVTARVYAVNYNVLRIMSGMGGVSYSN